MGFHGVSLKRDFQARTIKAEMASPQSKTDPAHAPSVLFVNRIYPPGRGATGRMLRDLARAFARDGWNVTVLTTGPQSRSEKDGAVRVIRVASRMRGQNIFGYGWVWIRFLIAGARLPRHDLVVSMTDPPMLVLVGWALARWRKARHIHWCQDLYPDLLPVLGMPLPEFMMKGLRALSHRALKRCDRVVAIGRCMARGLVQAGIDAKRIAVIPNWPDAELLNVAAPASTTAQTSAAEQGRVGTNGSAHARPFEELFRDGDAPKFRVLYAGTLGRAHPVATILDAAARLATTHPQIEFVFVGDGPGHEKLATERARRGLENVRLLPWQPSSRLRDLMESGDVHLLSMSHDAAGMLVPCKLYAALAAARPCIFVGPVQSEVARVINDFKAGTIIAQGEDETLAQVVASYCENGDLWFAAHAGAGQAGRIFIPDEAIAAWIKRARDTIGVRK